MKKFIQLFFLLFFTQCITLRNTNSMQIKKVQTVFDQWAQTERGVKMTNGHRHIYTALLEDYKLEPVPESFLDLGCGFGALLEVVQNLGTNDLKGIDASLNMVHQTQKNVPRANIQQSFFEDLPFKDNQFSHVASVEAVYYSNDPYKTLKEARRVLKEGGRFDILIDFYEENASTKIWEKNLNIPLIFWSELRWEEELERTGFKTIKRRRIKNPNKEKLLSEFKPSPYFPNKKDFLDYIEQGTLWITAS